MSTRKCIARTIIPFNLIIVYSDPVTHEDTWMNASLSVKILPYEYVAPEGFLITPSGGYVFYNSRIDYLRAGRSPVFNPATGLVPGARLSNFRTNAFSNRPSSTNIMQSVSLEENGNYQHEGELVESTFYQLDMHRWVNTQIQKNQSFKTTNIPLSEIAEGTKAFEQTVRDFTTKYGDFFTSNVHSDSFQENRLDDFFNLLAGQKLQINSDYVKNHADTFVKAASTYGIYECQISSCLNVDLTNSHFLRIYEIF